MEDGITRAIEVNTAVNERRYNINLYLYLRYVLSNDDINNNNDNT